MSALTELCYVHLWLSIHSPSSHYSLRSEYSTDRQSTGTSNLEAGQAHLNEVPSPLLFPALSSSPSPFPTLPPSEANIARPMPNPLYSEHLIASPESRLVFLPFRFRFRFRFPFRRPDHDALHLPSPSLSLNSSDPIPFPHQSLSHPTSTSIQHPAPPPPTAPRYPLNSPSSSSTQSRRTAIMRLSRGDCQRRAGWLAGVRLAGVLLVARSFRTVWEMDGGVCVCAGIGIERLLRLRGVRGEIGEFVGRGLDEDAGGWCLL